MCPPLSALGYSATLKGLVDACTIPTFGFTNRGCNCTTPCTVSSKLGPVKACEVDPLCPSSYLSSASASGWYDFCDTPSSKQPSAVVLSYCDINFFRAECQNASVPIAKDVQALGALLTIKGSNYTFSFLDVTFAKTIGAGGSGPTSSGRSSGGFSVPGSGLLASVDVGRMTSRSSVPLFGAMVSTITVVAAIAFVTTALSLLSVCFAVCKASRRKKTSLRQALESTAHVAKKGSKATFTIPLSLALRGTLHARFKGEQLVLDGTTYSIRAQDALFERLSLSFSLCEAHESLKPKHLTLAETDGVFGAEVPGLLFILSYFWANKKDFAFIEKALIKKDKAGERFPRAVEEGYCDRLKQWIKACELFQEERLGGKSKVSFVLDDRLKHPLQWEDFSWEGSNNNRSRRGSRTNLIVVDNPLKSPKSPRKG